MIPGIKKVLNASQFICMWTYIFYIILMYQNILRIIYEMKRKFGSSVFDWQFGQEYSRFISEQCECRGNWSTQGTLKVIDSLQVKEHSSASIWKKSWKTIIGIITKHKLPGTNDPGTGSIANYVIKLSSISFLNRLHFEAIHFKAMNDWSISLGKGQFALH